MCITNANTEKLATNTTELCACFDNGCSVSDIINDVIIPKDYVNDLLDQANRDCNDANNPASFSMTLVAGAVAAGIAAMNF